MHSALGPPGRYLGLSKRLSEPPLVPRAQAQRNRCRVGKNFVRIDLLDHTPYCGLFDWIREQGMQWRPIFYLTTKWFDTMLDETLGQAQQYTEALYGSVDIRPCPERRLGTATPPPCGLITEALLAVQLVAMTSVLVVVDLLEVSSL